MADEEPTDEAIQEMVKSAFKNADTDGNGVITKAELGAVMKKIGDWDEEDIDDLFEAIDTSGDGLVQYEEYVKWVFADMEEAADKFGIEEGLSVEVVKAWNIPEGQDWFGGIDPFITLEILDADGEVLATRKSRVAAHKVKKSQNETVWGHRLHFEEAREWDVDKSSVRITLSDKDTFSDDFVGSATIDLRQLIEKPNQRFMLMDASGMPLLSNKSPYMPCEILFAVEPSTLPPDWPRPQEAPRYDAKTYPKHAFLMTRGTRGDVQPFVALARGMAEQFGWLVTICTELRWRGFVHSKAKVSRGRIRFRCSGGDTQLRMQGWMAQQALKSNSELIQMSILANSESEFFPSTPVFVHHVLQAEEEPKPVDLVVFGLTVGGAAGIISEYCKKPIAGFFLQPTCIPSEDEAWKAVIPLQTHGMGLVDFLESKAFTSQASLAFLKGFAEKNPFAKWNINKMRGWFDLKKADTWDLFKKNNTPIVIPMSPTSFKRPFDWWDGIHNTDFIFLRGGGGSGSLGEPLEGFISAAHDTGGKLGLMTFSSMPVPRQTMLKCATKMVEECKFGLRLIYAGPKQGDEIPEALEEKAAALTEEGRFLELEKADFGELFKHMDCFVVHGGLGTTVEALRIKKPTVVTGPLLLDQRFWGGVCFDKGVGPESVHIDNFEEVCVSFADGALDPADPQGWQATCQTQDWGDVTQDGVAANAEWFQHLLQNGDGYINQ